MTARRAFAALAIAALVAAGCGGDDDDAQGQVDPTPMEQRSDEDVAADEVASGDIEGLVITDDLDAGHSRGELPYSSLTPITPSPLSMLSRTFLIWLGSLLPTCTKRFSTANSQDHAHAQTAVSKTLRRAGL